MGSAGGQRRAIDRCDDGESRLQDALSRRNRRLRMELRAGTSGYSYKEWCGHFYPEKLPGSEMLRYYAERFTTVEINNTFYRMPPETMLAQWIDQVPGHFTFTLKAPRRITHDNRLRDSEGNVAEFLRRADTLGNKLGVILFQLPDRKSTRLNSSHMSI